MSPNRLFLPGKLPAKSFSIRNKTAEVVDQFEGKRIPNHPIIESMQHIVNDAVNEVYSDMGLSGIESEES